MGETWGDFEKNKYRVKNARAFRVGGAIKGA